MWDEEMDFYPSSPSIFSITVIKYTNGWLCASTVEKDRTVYWRWAQSVYSHCEVSQWAKDIL
jgi:hypothetical protein